MNWRIRGKVIGLAKTAYHEANQALDRFAADKDEEAIKLLAMARQDIDSALHLIQCNQKLSNKH